MKARTLSSGRSPLSCVLPQPDALRAHGTIGQRTVELIRLRIAFVPEALQAPGRVAPWDIEGALASATVQTA